MTHPVMDEAVKKSAVAWISVDDGPALALWCMPWEGSLYVVSGPGEQAAPGLASAERAHVTLRGDHGGRIVSGTATVGRVEPGNEEWEAVIPQLAGKRLNAPGGPVELAARWAKECVVSRITPQGEPTEVGPSLSAAVHAEPPRDSAATRRTARPFRLHRVRRR